MRSSPDLLADLAPDPSVDDTSSCPQISAGAPCPQTPDGIAEDPVIHVRVLDVRMPVLELSECDQTKLNDERDRDCMSDGLVKGSQAPVSLSKAESTACDGRGANC